MIKLIIINLSIKRVKELSVKDKRDERESERDTIKFKLRSYV